MVRITRLRNPRKKQCQPKSLLPRQPARPPIRDRATPHHGDEKLGALGQVHDVETLVIRECDFEDVVLGARHGGQISRLITPVNLSNESPS